ncbi:Phosphatidate cytidylyltransferase [Polaromonas vacuolata]|uniref:Phosphatidate cytidylyltransferase n=1 Tax=Polaromonas vacuolata TaxID=37448 RepID=A0A6H2HAJ4_9BURK|nr:phosphatidate cytidylyltransferase [Polaromonas vacuolata]QJC56898.1 Phosphatidate cytidylyltransferase [Polaromonas vacuolata]
MLKQRVITAIVLLAILLPALFYPSPYVFASVALVLIAAGAWEWGKLNGCSQPVSLLLGAICVAMCALSWRAGLIAMSLPLLWTLAGSAWVLLGAWLLRQGVAGWSRIPRVLRLAGGLLALWLAWLAIAQARLMGVNFLLSVLTLVWVADIGAYFAGRAFGGRFSQSKLAATISPGKSWEGVWGGMAGVLVLGLAWTTLDTYMPAVASSFYSRLLSQHGLIVLLLAMLFMTAMSVVGDLFESLVKRSAGAKDSSGLLPGHGGVLDRVDALLPALPLAMMLASL